MISSLSKAPRAGSVRTTRGSEAPRRVTRVASTATETAWTSWNRYMSQRKEMKTEVIKPTAEEKKVFSNIGTAISKSATTFTPKFVGKSSEAGTYKTVHVAALPKAVPLSADLHEKLETIAMVQIKKALGLPDSAPLDVATTSASSTDINAGVCMSGFITQDESGKKAILAIVATETERVASWSRLEGLLLHWACSASVGAGWHMPPPKWQALLPNKTSDAGGAVQCAFDKLAVAGDNSTIYTLVLSLPLSGVLRSGGISFVLKATAAQNTKWLKEARGASETDFFVDLQSLPFCKI
ncbi:hypothetical protein FOA52_003900 [Chlamydomonas sp. UWO 241]|nr:hypothetical protein FOA52_003900 [Chlamydomonas sp. UWO 241]